MKCMIAISDKLGSVPLAECGGAVLAPGDKLLVTPGLMDLLKANYGKLIVCAGAEERASLSSGSYEYVAGKGKAISQDLPVAPLAEKSADKSMIGKMKRAVKG